MTVEITLSSVPSGNASFFRTAYRAAKNGDHIHVTLRTAEETKNPAKSKPRVVLKQIQEAVTELRGFGEPLDVFTVTFTEGDTEYSALV